MTALALGPQATRDGYRLAVYDRVDSTNTEAMRLLRKGEAGPLWIVASEQTAGRGRRGREWSSHRENLAATLLICGRFTIATAATLGFVASLTVLRAAHTLAPEMPLSLKWPNDVQAGGKKLAGLLLESHDRGDATAMIIGFGINIGVAPQGPGINATSMAEWSIQVSRAAMLAQLTDIWVEIYRRWDDGNGFAQIRQDWLAHAAGIGQPVSVSEGGREERGIFRTLDGEGHLVLDLPDGRCRTVSAGEVFFGDVATASAQAMAGL